MSTRFTALTITEGDAFLLEEDGWKCLFDSGVGGTIVDLLKYKGIDKLDLAICSHNDEDHAQGFIELLKSGFQIDEIWLPGLWASILQFVKDNCESSEEIECDNESYEKILDSLFLEESELSKVSESCESFNKTLEFCARRVDENSLYQFEPVLHQKLTDFIIENPKILAQFIADNLPNYLNDDLCFNASDNPLITFAKDFLGVDLNQSTCRDLVELSLNNSIDSLKTNMFEYIQNAFQDSSGSDYAKYKIRNSLHFKLKRIVKLAGLAYHNGCKIRWFEPSRERVNTPKTIDHGFLALNSNEVFNIKKIKSPVVYFYALSLTAENRYSLVYEYWKNRIPIIRFSADSRITCQSQSPYKENIIVTAPHHGSAANAAVYMKLKGNDIIWVRSDEVNPKRPCSEFKRLRNKYCLSCYNFNFVSEICFEYSLWDKKWHHIRGEQCRCK